MRRRIFLRRFGRVGAREGRRCRRVLLTGRRGGALGGDLRLVVERRQHGLRDLDRVLALLPVLPVVLEVLGAVQLGAVLDDRDPAVGLPRRLDVVVLELDVDAFRA